MKLLCAVALGLHILYWQIQIYIYFTVKGERKVKSPLTLHDTHCYLAVTICSVCVLLPFTRAK